MGGVEVKEEDAEDGGRGGFTVVKEEIRGGMEEEQLVEGTELQTLVAVVDCTAGIGMWFFPDKEVAEAEEVEMWLWTVGVGMLGVISAELCGCF